MGIADLKRIILPTPVSAVLLGKIKVQKTQTRSKSVPVTSPQARAEEALSFSATKPPQKEAIIRAKSEKAVIASLGSLNAIAVAEKIRDKIAAVSIAQVAPRIILFVNFLNDPSLNS